MKNPLKNLALLFLFFMGLSLVIKFHINEVFCLTLLNETMGGAYEMRTWFRYLLCKVKVNHEVLVLLIDSPNSYCPSLLS